MQPAQPTVLQPSLEQRIHHAAWAWVAVIVLSALLQLLRRAPILNWFIIVDILLVSALAYALYRKSRFAAVALPVYFLGAGLWQLFGLHHGAPLGPWIILAFFLPRGITAVFEYHNRRRTGSVSDAA